uniref:Kynureninase n=1 Tax=Panagrellus redivivus TaxID=6233 RepID=A0A7E4VJY2_PANRE
MSLSKTVDVETFLVGTAVQAGLHPKREYLLSRAVALAADNQDPLRKLRNEFFYPKKSTLPDVDPKLIDPDEDSIYLCGNSLGLMPKATKEITREQFEKWAHM